jgi:hypothetical protein
MWRALLPVLLCGCVSAQPRAEVTLAWDASPPQDMVLVYRLYVSTEYNPGERWSLFYASDSTPVVPDEGTKGVLWGVIAEIPATETRVTVPVTWSWDAPVFFSLTASNRVAESEMSNIAWLPSIPLRGTTLRTE